MIARHLGQQAVFHPDKHTKADLLRGEFLYAGLNAFEPGQTQPVHAHAGQDKMYYVLEGAGVIEVGSESYAAAAGDLVLAPAGVPHGVVNPGPGRLVLMVIFGPPPPVKPSRA